MTPLDSLCGQPPRWSPFVELLFDYYYRPWKYTPWMGE